MTTHNKRFEWDAKMDARLGAPTLRVLAPCADVAQLASR